MPAPTALQRAAPEEIAQNLHDAPAVTNADDDDMLISTTDAPAPMVQETTQPAEDTEMAVDSEARPLFAAEKNTAVAHRSEVSASLSALLPLHRSEYKCSC